MSALPTAPPPYDQEHHPNTNYCCNTSPREQDKYIEVFIITAIFTIASQRCEFLRFGSLSKTSGSTK